MANLIMSLDDIAIFISNLICEITGLPQDKVLLMYAIRGQSVFDINTNACYVTVKNEDEISSIFKNRSKEYNAESESYIISQQSTRMLSIEMVFYGPNCLEYATQVNEMLYSNNYKLQLDNQNLFIVPDRTMGPQLTRELSNTRWYKRADLKLRMYNPVCVEEEVKPFTSTNINLEFDF